MTHTKDEALKLALEALEQWNTPLYKRGTVITAIKEALAAPVQEPVAWATADGSHAHVSWGKDRPDYPIRYEVPLYTTPPAAQRQWVGLTDEEKITMSGYDLHYAALIGQVERKLKEKNT